MGFSVHWIWFAALSYLLYMVGEVWSDCTLENMQIAGGHYTLSRELKSGSMLVYFCPEDYYPYPALTRLCQGNNNWQPAPKRFSPQRCRMVECPDPNVLEYGYVNPPLDKYFVGNETTFECYTGYELRGSSKRVCLPNGKWSGSTPICSSDTGDNCADPGIPPGASRTGNVFEIGDRVKYTCNGNLFMVGSKERVCQENGQWTGIEPACYYTHTYDTPEEVSEAFGSAIKDSLTTLQPIDDTQDGRRFRISKNGTLNIYIAVDISESIDEGYFKNATDAVKTLISKISSFPVTPNYEILFFSSEIHEIISIVDFFDGKIERSELIPAVTNFTIGDRNTAGTDLNRVFKTFLHQMGVIRERVGVERFKEHRHVLLVFTDGAFNMGGLPAPTVAQIKNMVYMNHTTAEHTQSREEYLDIYIFAIGAQIIDDDLMPLIAGKEGQHYFRMKDIKNLQETFDQIINEDELMGLCGLHKDYVRSTDTDKVSKRKMYPWLAFVIVQNHGQTRKCLGSLVTPKFVLTAAHCFAFDDLPNHVTVEIDDGGKRSKKVEKFTIHENYNVNKKKVEGVAEFYDFDVALIQLKQFVDISVITRPICIPCTQETSDALNLVGASTCKDQEDLLLKKHLETLSFLTRTENLVDKKTVSAKIGNNRDECISHALQAPGITVKDPKVAVTDNFMCTGGQFPQRDHIACKGDSGGAVFKNYQLRTIQVALVSWGTKDMCDAGGLVESDSVSRDFHVNLFRVVPFLKSILGKETNEYAKLTFLDN